MNPIMHTVDGRDYEIRTMQTDNGVGRRELLSREKSQSPLLGHVRDSARLPALSRPGQRAIDMLAEIAKGDVDAGIVNLHLLDIAIRALDASGDEKAALLEILGVEGFGGREDRAVDEPSAREVAEERLLWLRGQREEGLR